MPDPTRCPAAPAGESHRWRIPDQGVTAASRCRYCGAERLFPAYTDATRWDSVTAPAAARRLRGAEAANEASRRAKAARKAAE